MDPSIFIFIALTVFLGYRLFTVLGTKGGHEPDEADRPVLSPVGNDRAAQSEDTQDAPPVRAKRVPAWAKDIREDDPGFDAAAFQEGAKAAYEMIVTAFAKGDLTEVVPYIDPAIRKAFEVAIDGRQGAGQAMEVEFVGVEAADVVRAERESAHHEVTVDFRSDQIRVTRDKDGEVIDGDPNRIDAVRDRWVFSRPVTQTDPNWTLISTTAPDEHGSGDRVGV